ncbi:MAG: NADH-quinone oxidoreductase subunit N [Bacteroidia bacterium]|nr:NADH-quinone oxidoreductase subunit N [Bacteroidia bacterium]
MLYQITADSLNQITGSLPWLLPECCLLISLSVGVLLMPFTKENRALTAQIQIVGIILSGIFLLIVPVPKQTIPLFYGMISADGWAQVGRMLGWLIVCGFLVFSWYHFPQKPSVEYWLLASGFLFGSHLVVSAGHFLLLFIGIELISISSYVYVAYFREDTPSSEAALKYFLYGSVASGTMLYGISVLYGLTHEFQFQPNFIRVASTIREPALAVGILLFLVGILFKFAAVPFHFWAPDVYQGSSFPVLSLLTVAPKMATMIALSRILPFLPQITWIFIGLSTIAIASMTVGNLAAIQQTSFRRLIAYSGIAQTGYWLPLLLIPGTEARVPLAFFMLSYWLMNFTILWITSANDSIAEWSGIGKKNLLSSLILSIALLSLAGLPPTIGLIAKFQIVLPIWKIWVTQQQIHWLIILIAVILNTILAFYYYLRPIANMFLKSSVKDFDLFYAVQQWVFIFLGICLLIPGFWGFDKVIQLLQQFILGF